MGHIRILRKVDRLELVKDINDLLTLFYIPVFNRLMIPTP